MVPTNQEPYMPPITHASLAFSLHILLAPDKLDMSSLFLDKFGKAVFLLDALS